MTEKTSALDQPLELPSFCCRYQSVGRSVKLVTNESQSVCGYKSKYALRSHARQSVEVESTPIPKTTIARNLGCILELYVCCLDPVLPAQLSYNCIVQM